MKIVLYALNFAPEPIGIGKYVGEMAQWLMEHGHEVRVVTAPPYYPSWRRMPGYRKHWYSYEERRGVKIWRAPLYVPAKPRGLNRIVHLVSFAITSFPLLLRQVLWAPDVIWVVEPPLFCTPGALIVAKLFGARSWLHIQDYEVSAGFELGLLKGKLMRDVVLAAESWIMRQFDRVSSISAQMLESAAVKTGIPERLCMFPNWVDTQQIVPRAGPNRYRKELGIGDDHLVVLYSGNMGAKQGLEVMASAAKLLHGYPKLVFVFCGAGACKVDLVRACEGLSNVRFTDLQPTERLGEWLGMADIHLLPQRLNTGDLVLPSKLTGMLASGRPVVATAMADTDLGRIVVNCGLITEPQSAEALARAITHLAEHPDLRISLGNAARQFAVANLGRDAVLRAFEMEVSQLVGQAPQAKTSGG